MVEKLFEEHKQNLKNISGALAHKFRMDPEQVLSEVYLIFVEALQKQQYNITKLRSYIYSCAYNHLINKIVHENTQKTPVLANVALEDVQYPVYDYTEDSLDLIQCASVKLSDRAFEIFCRILKGDFVEKNKPSVSSITRQLSMEGYKYSWQVISKYWKEIKSFWQNYRKSS